MSIDMEQMAKLEELNAKLKEDAQRRETKCRPADRSPDITQLTPVPGGGWKISGMPPDGQNDLAECSPVNRPTHYVVMLNDGTQVECVDVIEAIGMTHNVASAFEYVWRSDSKGTQVQDLKKAIWRLQREVATLEPPDGVPPSGTPPDA